MGFAAKRVKNLTVPVLKLVQDETRYVKFRDKMHLGKPQKEEADGKKKEPATLANVLNLEDGAECQIIISAVVKSVLTDEYPEHAYVGKCFAITKRGRSPGKQYNAFEVEEIEDPQGEVSAPESEPAAVTDLHKGHKRR